MTSGVQPRSAAVAKCRTTSFTGGPAWISQWTDRRYDFNITCPGVTGRQAAHPLTQYAGTSLRRGSRGAAVAALQQALGVQADGRFGPRTQAAVVRLQTRRDLPATGVVDRATWRKLGAGTGDRGQASLFPQMFAST
ncbi:MAG: peptidoglycan-binding protein [Actinomycetota bacterium]|nr:peptidoglycan-binding protein [Actinomycetota bacterium]